MAWYERRGVVWCDVNKVPIYFLLEMLKLDTCDARTAGAICTTPFFMIFPYVYVVYGVNALRRRPMRYAKPRNVNNKRPCDAGGICDAMRCEMRKATK
jgi:hypothetical protein